MKSGPAVRPQCCSSDTCRPWCSSRKMPHGAGQGSQDTTAADWLAGQQQLLSPAHCNLAAPYAISAATPEPKLQVGTLSRKTYAAEGAAERNRCGVGGEALLWEVKEIQRACLGGNGQQPDAGCSKTFDAYSHPSPSLPDLSILTSIWASDHLCASKNNHASSRLPQRVHVSSNKRKTAIFK